MEELKMVLVTLNTLGVEVKWAFIAWLGYKLVINGLGLLLGLYLVIRVFNHLKHYLDLEHIIDKLKQGCHHV